jgi:membrane-associated HD superfamily phosphohydrolase
MVPPFSFQHLLYLNPRHFLYQKNKTHTSLLVTIQLHNLLLLLHGTFSDYSNNSFLSPNAIQRTPSLFIFFFYLSVLPFSLYSNNRLSFFNHPFQFKSTIRFQHLPLLDSTACFQTYKYSCTQFNGCQFIFSRCTSLLVLQFRTTALIYRIPQFISSKPSTFGSTARFHTTSTKQIFLHFFQFQTTALFFQSHSTIRFQHLPLLALRHVFRLHH